MKLLDTMLFGPLAPDQPDLNNPGIEGARNCLPRLRGYDSLPELLDYGTDKLPERPVGAFGVKSKPGVSAVYAGTSDRLWLLADTVWGDQSRPAGYTAGSRWDFAQFDNSVIAVHLEDPLQWATIAAGAFSDMQAAINAACVATIRGFCVIGDVDDTDGPNPYRVRWSPLDDPSGDWTPSPTTLANFNDLRSQGGKILKIVGGEYGLVFRERAIHRMTFTGASIPWQFDRIDPEIGTIAYGSVIQHGARCFFFSEDGVRLTVGDASQSLGEEQIDLAFLSDLDSSHLDRISGSVYSDEQIIIWAYPGAGNIGGQPNRLLIYNYGTNRWATGDEAVEILFKASTPFRSIDGFDDDPTFGGTQTPALYASIDDIPGSLDDKVWAGGEFQIGAISDSFDLAFYSGPPRPAQFETGERQLTPARRTYVSEMRALINSSGQGGPSSIDIEVGHRDCQTAPVVWSPVTRPQNNGIACIEVDDRFHRFRVTAREGFEDAVGLGVYGSPSSGV